MFVQGTSLNPKRNKLRLQENIIDMYGNNSSNLKDIRLTIHVFCRFLLFSVLASLKHNSIIFQSNYDVLRL